MGDPGGVSGFCGLRERKRAVIENLHNNVYVFYILVTVDAPLTLMDAAPQTSSARQASAVRQPARYIRQIVLKQPKRVLQATNEPFSGALRKGRESCVQHRKKVARNLAAPGAPLRFLANELPACAANQLLKYLVGSTPTGV